MFCATEEQGGSLEQRRHRRKPSSPRPTHGTSSRGPLPRLPVVQPLSASLPQPHVHVCTSASLLTQIMLAGCVPFKAGFKCSLFPLTFPDRHLLSCNPHSTAHTCAPPLWIHSCLCTCLQDMHCSAAICLSSSLSIWRAETTHSFYLVLTEIHWDPL